MLKRTALHSVYSQTTGVKLVDFGGWEMPLQFAGGILSEHSAVRNFAGLFDVSHMGEIQVEGDEAEEFLDELLTNRIRGAETGRCIYSPMCLENGGTVDDLLVYVLDNKNYLLVVNASNIEKDYSWIRKQLSQSGKNVEVTNVSNKWAQLAVQGPVAEKLLSPMLKSVNLESLDYYRHTGSVDCSGVPVLLSRTGYTGEDGFEIYCKPAHASELWNQLVSAGAVPCGLGARDMLRLEARLPLYGHELSDEISPLEAGLGMFVKLDKQAFIGKDALERQKANGVPRRIYGIEMRDAGVARNSYKVYSIESDILGHITSGSRSPVRESFIALALLSRDSVRIGDIVNVEIRQKYKAAEIVKTPFYKRPAADPKLSKN